MKNSQGIKMIYYVIKLRVSRKKDSESNSILTLVRLHNDSMEG
jgi:hypothetical protein